MITELLMMRCDVCERRCGEHDTDAVLHVQLWPNHRALTRVAAASGWYVDATQHLCPDCWGAQIDAVREEE